MGVASELSDSEAHPQIRITCFRRGASRDNVSYTTGLSFYGKTVAWETYLIQTVAQHDVRDDQLQNHLHVRELLVGSHQRRAH